ncbi:unnamed protein product, partial [Meganyctiphanes norvegica]
ECICKDTIKHYITEESNIPVTAFMTEDNYITLNLAFENKDEALDMDFITIKRESYEITKIRNTERENIKSFNLSSPMPFGWINMSIIVNKHEIQIKPYMDKIVSEFTIRQIIIASKNMTSCDKGTPSWKIARDQSVEVPLNGLSTSRVSITSPKDFSPVFSILGNKYYFAKELGVILGTSGSKLPGNIYSFVIENDNDTISVTHQQEECGAPIAFFKLQTILTNITVSSLDEDFILTLEPTVNKIKACETNPCPAEGEDHSTVIIVLSVLISAILIGALVVMFIRRK